MKTSATPAPVSTALSLADYLASQRLPVTCYDRNLGRTVPMTANRLLLSPGSLTPTQRVALRAYTRDE